jgi:cytochrome c-type biogenesis protein CcmH/NrfG
LSCSLGYCYLKLKDYGAALRAFTRCSQLDPDNGEAWNNLAAIHMHLQHWKQAYNALSGGQGAGGSGLPGILQVG